MKITTKTVAGLLLACATLTVGAQENMNKGMWGGLRIGYGTRIESAGVGLKLQNWLNEWIRVEAGGDYFFEKDHSRDLGNMQSGPIIWARKYSLYDLTAGIHIVVPVWGKFQPYCSADVVMAAWNYNSKVDIHTGPNLGAGFDVVLSPKARINMDWHYHLVSDYDQSVFSLGLSFRL